MHSDDIANFNALLEEEFEDKFSEIFHNSNADEKYFLTIHKYCLRKKYVSCFRKTIGVRCFSRILYSGFVKFDSYFMLTFKVFCNLVVYFFIFPIFQYGASPVRCNKNLRQAYPSNAKERSDDSIYYPGTLLHFFKYFNKIESLFTLKHIFHGIKNLKVAKLSFVIEASKIFCGNKINLYFSFSVIIFYSIYSVCKEMLTKEHDVLDEHFCYGSVVAPQKIFSLHFLKQNKESTVISHGNFHDPQCTYQPATSFIDLDGIKGNSGMGCDRYFASGELVNPCRSIPFRERVFAFKSLSHVVNSEPILKSKSSSILVFSSTYDCGIGRDPYYGLFLVMRLLRERGFKNLKIKLHPSESRFFFQFLHLIEFHKLAHIVDSKIVFSQIDIGFGMPSTFICDLVNVPKIYVYSPLEYVNYDFVHGKKVKYFSEIT